MALFKILKGQKADLPATKHEGYAYVTADEHKMYIDITDANRIALNSDMADRIPYSVNGQNSVAYNKTITTTDPFELKTGALIAIKFTADNPGGVEEEDNIITFNVNNTGQKNVYYRGARIPNEFISNNKTYLFLYNGTQYELVGDVIPDQTDQSGKFLTTNGTAVSWADVGIGHMSPGTGLYAPSTISPAAVGNGSLLITEASNTTLGAKSLSVTTGFTLSLSSSAAAGATTYQVTNNYTNRILCTIALGGVACLNEENAANTVKITSITLDGATITPSSTNSSYSKIIITTATSANPFSSTLSLRIYPDQKGFSNLIAGAAGTGGSYGYSVVAGQQVGNKSNASAVFGNAQYNTGNSSLLAGRQHINTKQNAFLAGYGHDTTNGSTEVTAVGKFSKIDSTTAFAVGAGTSATSRTNIFEVHKDGTATVGANPVNNMDVTTKQYVDAAIPSVPTGSSTSPKMDGTATVGTETTWSHGDHVHPTDTSRQATITASGILKGDGSGGITAAVSGTDYIASLTSGTGISVSGTTINHSNSVTAGTAGTSSATSGATLAVPYVTYNATGHITAAGTHTHTISGFAASSHNHAAGDINSGTLGVARGGTGLTASPSILINLSSSSASNVMQANPRPGVTGTLGLGNGGTGATTAAAARANLGTLGSKTANGYEGITNMAGADNVWIRTTSQGIIPYQSGAKGSGHNSLGTSSWYFANAYIDNISTGTLTGNVKGGNIETGNGNFIKIFNSDGTQVGLINAIGITGYNSSGRYTGLLTWDNIPNLHTGTLTVNKGGTGATSFTANSAIVSGSTTTAALTTRTIRNNTATSRAVTADTALITSNTLRYAINRTTSVAAADANYTTYMARGESLNSAATNPTVNGTIAWQYE